MVEIAVKLVRLGAPSGRPRRTHRAAARCGGFHPHAASVAGDTTGRPPTRRSAWPSRQTRALDEIKKIAEARGVEFFFAQFVDMYGRPSAKLVPAANLDDLVADGRGLRRASPPARSARCRATRTSPRCRTSSSFTPVPWQPNLARFACDITVEGEPWPYCPRTILRNQLARAKELGYEFKIGLELEYFLVRRREDGSIEIADAQDTLDKPCYDMAGPHAAATTSSPPSRSTATSSGWGNYANDHEDANGQFEQNFAYDDALVSCDRAIFFRYMVHTLAEQHGMIATFMPKPFTSLTGNGCHFHMSLWRTANERLPRRGRPARARALRARRTTSSAA